jgi:N-acetylglucosamine kinase-like BadF-type ATPase
VGVSGVGNDAANPIPCFGDNNVHSVFVRVSRNCCRRFVARRLETPERDRHATFTNGHRPPSISAGATMMAQSESAADLLLAVDAGGSKTVACLARSTSPRMHQILGRGRAGGGNPLSVGIDEATRAIDVAVTAARRAANLADVPVVRAVLAVAGAANPDMARQLERWAYEVKLADRVAVVSDVFPILAAGTEDGVGVALIAGTGSVAFGRAADGRTIRCGGWGYLVGDDGSGYSIGRAGLRLALQDYDANGGTLQPLAATVVHELQTGTAADLVKAIYTSDNPRALIASLAPLVVKAAKNGDSTAQQILAVAAHDLAALAAQTARAVGLAEQSFSLALAGGVLVGSLYVREQVAARLAAMAILCEMCVVDDPLAGCLRLADPESCGSMIEWH